MLRIGHKGAHAIVAGNTLESFDVALATGVDAIELDVLRARDGKLVVAHDKRELRAGTHPELHEALEHLAHSSFATIELVVDLKTTGYEAETVAAVTASGFASRTLFTSQHPRSLTRVRSAGSGLRTGWSVPKARHDWMQTPLLPIAAPVYSAWYIALPELSRLALTRGHCAAIIAHYRFVRRRLVEAVHAAGGQLYVWTVDDRPRIEQLANLGVDAVITNDPRLFI